MAKLRIGLTISGAVSLGAYEGGALAALLLAVQRMQGAVVVDAITGASAAGRAGVLPARGPPRGADPGGAGRRGGGGRPPCERVGSPGPPGPRGGFPRKPRLEVRPPACGAPCRVASFAGYE